MQQDFSLFPSIGDYSLYNDDVYRAFLRAPIRNAAFRDAITVLARDKVALDIGTGKDALWAIACARSGAAHVYAVEEIPAVASRARFAVRRARMDDKITIIQGRSGHIELPQRADLCISETIGNIATSEGVQAIIADARKRLCTEGASFIPYSSSTLVGAISFGSASPGPQVFAIESLPYVRRAFEATGRPFDLRLCIAGPAQELLISSTCEIEEIILDQVDPGINFSRSQKGSLCINSIARLHGLMAWPRIHCLEKARPYDSLMAYEAAWAPLYVPLSLEGIPVLPGEHLSYTFTTDLSDDGVHPDYAFTGVIQRANGKVITFEWKSPYHDTRFRASDTYRFLFPE
jgi:protein arginine N-methyltransferase 1